MDPRGPGQPSPIQKMPVSHFRDPFYPSTISVRVLSLSRSPTPRTQQNRSPDSSDPEPSERHQRPTTATITDRKCLGTRRYPRPFCPRQSCTYELIYQWLSFRRTAQNSASCASPRLCPRLFLCSDRRLPPRSHYSWAFLARVHRYCVRHRHPAGDR